MSSFNPNRNPVIIPERTEIKRACPRCSGTNFGGRKIQGALTFTCRDCKNEWSGGLPYEPLDPRQPRPPEDPNYPLIIQHKNRGGEIIEERRPISLAQEFRKGAPIPLPGEEDI